MMSSKWAANQEILLRIRFLISLSSFPRSSTASLVQAISAKLLQNLFV